MWPVFQGQMILPCILKIIWRMIWLEFYDTVNTVKVMLSQSVNLLTLFLDSLSYQYMCMYFR